ncbi:MAG TPA: SulP family inorganic anion transporter, partial [Fluviicola sp.]|nr:SulP family inorganic anion transporter [Fluviicola sp.]
VYHITLTEHMTFLNKASLVKAFSGIPENKKVIIDSSQSKFISQDIIESIEDFKEIAHEKKIELEIINPQNKK